MPRQHPARRKATDAVRRAAAALRACGMLVPRFTLTTEWPSLIGGSRVDAGSHSLHLNMGRYPVRFMREWFAQQPPRDLDDLDDLWRTCWTDGLARMV